MSDKMVDSASGNGSAPTNGAGGSNGLLVDVAVRALAGFDLVDQFFDTPLDVSRLVEPSFDLEPLCSPGQRLRDLL